MILGNAVGEVLLDDFSVHGYHIKRMIWPSYTVKLLLNKNWIQSRHIVAWRQASQSCPVTLLSNYMKKMVIEAGENYKTVYTRLFGMLGLSEQQSFEGFLTTSDEQCAQALRSHVGYQRKIIDEENQIYMLCKTETEQKLENYNPFFRFVASGSIVLLLELVSKMHIIDPTWRIISSRTDNVYFEGSEFLFDSLDNYLQSEWGFEYGDLEWKSFPLAKWEDPKPHTIVTENHEPRMEDISPTGGYQGTLKTGVAGCGKSRDMAKQLQSIIVEGQQQKQKVLMIAPTHKVRIAMEDVKKAPRKSDSNPR
jgi:nitrogen regulatory protein PII